MYNTFFILKNGEDYSCHISDIFYPEMKAKFAIRHNRENIEFAISAKSNDITELYLNMYYHIFDDTLEKEEYNNKLLILLWYTQYYLKFNDIKYNIVWNKYNIFNFEVK